MSKMINAMRARLSDFLYNLAEWADPDDTYAKFLEGGDSCFNSQAFDDLISNVAPADTPLYRSLDKRPPA